jgi:hypothetical protein
MLFPKHLPLSTVRGGADQCRVCFGWAFMVLMFERFHLGSQFLRESILEELFCPFLIHSYGHIDISLEYSPLSLSWYILMIISCQSWLYVLGQKRSDSYVLLEHSVKKAVHFGLPVRLIFLWDCLNKWCWAFVSFLPSFVMNQSEIEWIFPCAVLFLVVSYDFNY